MAKIALGKVATMPATPVSDAAYFIKQAGDTKFKLKATTSAGVVVDLDAISAAELATALLGKENAFAAGTTQQYLRGDKTWQTLNKSAVGLANVDNTSDATKPLSTAATTALNLKANDADVLHKTGNETKTSGILTFSVSPVVPNATTATQAAAYGQVTAGDTALQTQIDTLNTTAASGLKYKGDINASTNPNYPAGAVGDTYIVSTAGKIGGASGIDVEPGDMIINKAASAAGNHATVGGSWTAIQSNIGAASETVVGYSRKATTAEATAGSSDIGFMTPLKTQQKIDTTAIKFDVAQSLTTPQKNQALANIGALSLASITGQANVIPKYSGSGLAASFLSESADTIFAASIFKVGAAANFKQTFYGEPALGMLILGDATQSMYNVRYSAAGLGIDINGVMNNAIYMTNVGEFSFAKPVSGVAPTAPAHYVTKAYADAIAVSTDWFATEW